MNIGFIHGSAGTGSVTLRRTTATTANSEGRLVSTTVDVDLTSCRVAMLSARERIRESRPGVDIDGSVLVPLGTTADDGDEVIVAGIDPYLDGTWAVQAVRHAVVHLRLLVKRRGA